MKKKNNNLQLNQEIIFQLIALGDHQIRSFFSFLTNSFYNLI